MKRLKIIALIALLVMTSLSAAAQKSMVMNLWQGEAPNNNGDPNDTAALATADSLLNQQL